MTTERSKDTTESLKRCPFCDSDYAGRKQQISTDGEKYVNCLDCGAMAPKKDWQDAFCWKLLGSERDRFGKLESEMKAANGRLVLHILEIQDEAKLHGEECWWRDIRKNCEEALAENKRILGEK